MVTIPNLPETEHAVLGAMLLKREAVDAALEVLTPEDFYNPVNARIFEAISDLYEHGDDIDQTAVLAKMQLEGAASDHLGADLIRILSETIYTSPGYVNQYARDLQQARAGRDLMRQCQDVLQSVGEGGDPYDLGEALNRFTLTMGSNSTEQEAKTLDELLEMEDVISPVIIPGLMRQDHRTIIVAPEGVGKSSLCRQIAMCAAQGVHPFKHNPQRRFEAIRALVVDCENPLEAITENAVRLQSTLMAVLGPDYDDERCRFFRRPGGINLRNRRDQTDLQREIALHRPNLVVAGPTYKMFQTKGKERPEDAADEFLALWDKLRVKYDFALMLEMHAAKGSRAKGEMNPFGSQRFMAWPESGLALYDSRGDGTVLEVENFRHNRLTGTDWPVKLVRDPNWLFDGRYP